MLQKKEMTSISEIKRSDWLWVSDPYISMVKKLKQFCAPFWRLLCAKILGLE